MDGEEKHELRQWFFARDLLLGMNGCTVDPQKALSLARECKHEDAQWLAGLLAECVALTETTVLARLEREDGDPRALCFVAFLGDTFVYRPAAELGCGLAQALIASREQGEAKRVWAERAAANGEPLGLTLFATCLWSGNGCPCDRPRALRLYREAAELGLPWAMYIFGERAFSASNPERYRWWGLAAARRSGPAVDGLRQAAVLHASARFSRVLFEVGCVFERLDLVELRRVGEWTDAQAECVRAAVAHCAVTRRRARRALRWWTRAGMRLRVARDVRRLIAGLLWQDCAAWS